jgi:hypothetical protein
LGRLPIGSRPIPGALAIEEYDLETSPFWGQVKQSQAGIQKGFPGSKNKAPAFDLAKSQEVVEQEEGELSMQEQLRCKIGYFTDGMILGAAVLWKIIASS